MTVFLAHLLNASTEHMVSEWNRLDTYVVLGTGPTLFLARLKALEESRHKFFEISKDTSV